VSQPRVTRRQVLAAAGAGTLVGGFGLGLQLVYGGGHDAPIEVAEGAYAPNVFLQITQAGAIHFLLPTNEVGQGVWTGLTTLIAEELSTPPSRIHVDHGTVHPDFINPQAAVPGLQLTAASASMKGFYLHLRQLAANVRETLRLAAATKLGVAPPAVTFDDGQIWVFSKAFGFGEFVDVARQLEPVTDAPLKADDALDYIGKYDHRIDATAKSTGTARFGLDLDIPGMRKLMVKRCPVHGGRPLRFNEAEVLALPGVEHVLATPHSVAVVADSYWHAHKGLAALEVEWELPELARHDTRSVFADMEQALDADAGKRMQHRGRADVRLAEETQPLRAEFRTPYLAHASMEPLTCAVHIDGDICHLWDGTQSNTMTRDAAARTLGWPRQRIHLHPLIAGGGFGRRPYNDYVVEAVEVAQRIDKPVHLIWSREHDMRHDYYRPASIVRLRAAVSDDGHIEAWRADRAGPNLLPYVMDEMIDFLSAGKIPIGVADWLSKRNYDVFSAFPVDPYGIEGLWEEYDFPHLEVRERTVDAGFPVGFWRSVGHSANAFATESFIDELAHARGLDPVEFRLRNLRDNAEMATFVMRAAELSGWGAAPPPGRNRGFAMHRTYGTAVAQVAEISVDGDALQLHRVVCVVDCGRAVNPDIVRSQMESGILFGASAALFGEITLEGGAVVQSNFHDYPIVRMHQAPDIEVHILDSAELPTGVGEPATAPIAPAIANAVFAATGERVYELPLSRRFAIG